MYLLVKPVVLHLYYINEQIRPLSTILLIGHGIVNRFLAKELIAKGWASEQAPNRKIYRGYKYWEIATYTKTPIILEED